MRRYICSQLSYAFASEPAADPASALQPDNAASAVPPSDPAIAVADPSTASASSSTIDIPLASAMTTPSLTDASDEADETYLTAAHQHQTRPPPRHTVRKYLFSPASAPPASSLPAADPAAPPSARRRPNSSAVPAERDAHDPAAMSIDNATSTTTIADVAADPAATTSPADTPSTARRHHADHPGLRELRALADKTFGPVGHLKDTLAKRIPHDRLIETLNASVHDRNRLLIQFLRARQNNASEALAMITNSLRWRNSMNIHSFLHNPAVDVATFPACFPMHIISNPENSKQPVVYGLIRLLDRKAERVPFQNALLSFLESSYYGATYVDDEMIIILDFRDWSIRRNAPYRLVKDALQTLQDYYPERLRRVFLVNYPTSIRAAYTVISPVIDPGAKEKIVWIPDADPSITLRKYLTPKSIPSFLGGTLKAEFPSAWPDIEGEFAASRVAHK